MSYEKPEAIPLAVRESLHKNFGAEATAILKDLKWDALNGNYYFVRWNMYVGVEIDGYTHT